MKRIWRALAGTLLWLSEIFDSLAGWCMDFGKEQESE